MPGLPADHVLTIIRIKQWQQDRAALATSRTTDYTRTGWKQRNHRTADVGDDSYLEAAASDFFTALCALFNTSCTI